MLPISYPQWRHKIFRLQACTPQFCQCAQFCIRSHHPVFCLCAQLPNPCPYALAMCTRLLAGDWWRRRDIDRPWSLPERANQTPRLIPCEGPKSLLASSATTSSLTASTWIVASAPTMSPVLAPRLRSPSRFIPLVLLELRAIALVVSFILVPSLPAETTLGFYCRRRGVSQSQSFAKFPGSMRRSPSHNVLPGLRTDLLKLREHRLESHSPEL